MKRILLALALARLSAGAAGLTADSSRGRQLFESLACVQCHSLNGEGGTTAPDLGRMIDRGFTPATLAATMWNHAPGMWAAMQGRQISAGEMTPQDAQDLMAFFYAARFFEKPGDAARGLGAFQSLGCQGCHGLTTSANGGAKPASQWEALRDPFALVEAMWNHSAAMETQTKSRGRPLPQITAQELTDMLVYLRNLPGIRPPSGEFHVTAGESGDKVFQSAGCGACHQTIAALAARVEGQTLTEIAADMWNHAPRMIAQGSPPKLADGQMRELAGALWSAKFLGETGRPASGRRVFAEKNCAVCHNDAASGAPHLPAAGRSFSSATMVSVLWRHGPRMLDQMKSKGLEWPRFDGIQMSDLIAYLNSNPPGQP